MLRSASLLVVLLFFINPSYAEYDHFWLEYGVGLDRDGTSIKIKMRDGTKGWSLGYLRQKEEFWTSVRNRSTGEYVDIETNIVSITHSLNVSYPLGNSDISAGLGYAFGDAASRCEQTSAFITATDTCDIESISTLGIPFQATTNFGKYAGIGISLNFFWSPDHSEAMSTLTIPLGLFAR